MKNFIVEIISNEKLSSTFKIIMYKEILEEPDDSWKYVNMFQLEKKKVQF